jgi:YesN/AraC family two-component response regulator
MAYHDFHTEDKFFFYFEHSKNTFADPHFHSSSEFLFVEKGEIIATVDGETRVLKAGDACYSSEFCIHSFHCKNENQVYALLSQKRYTDRLFELFKKKQPPTFFKFDDFKMLEYFYSLIHKEYDSEENRQGMIEGFLQILFYNIAANHTFVSKKMATQSNLVCEILKYATENYEQPMSLDVLSKRFCYAKESLSRILHKHLSESWSTYINRLRVLQANRILLDHPEKSVLEVAYSCGFNSPNTFYRTYLKEFGYPPRNQPEKI